MGSSFGSPRVPCPVFLIYAGHGQGDEELNVDYFRAAGGPKALWKIPEVDHVGGFQARPREYERRVIGFFDHALLPPAARDPLAAASG